jgi:phage shock protein A
MGKIWNAIRAQFNKMANWFWSRDPIAQMQLEYDKAVAQMKEGRKGLEQYRGLVERVNRQVVSGEKRIQQLTAKIKAYLKSGDRATAGQLAIQLQQTQQELAENQEQLKMHEEAYQNNVEKIKHATKKLGKVREKIKKYEAELKMSQAEAELARLSQAFNFDVTTDFGELEQLIQEKIDLNRATVRVAADLSGEGVEEIKAEKAMEESLAEDLLNEFEVAMGIKTPETAAIRATTKALGPETAQAAEAAAEEPPVTEKEKQTQS